MWKLTVFLLCLLVVGCLPYFPTRKHLHGLQPMPEKRVVHSSGKSSTSSVVRVSVKILPYTNSFEMVEGDAYLFVLPSKRTVALWVTEGRTSGEHGTKAGLRCDWSERPHKDIPLIGHVRPNQEGLDLEWKSYIEQGPVIVHGKHHIEKHLYVDDLLFRYWQSKQSSPHLAVKVDITKRKQDHQP